MKRISAIAALLFFIGTVASAQTVETKPPQASRPDTEQELKAINREMHDTLLRGDKERLFSYFDDNFIGTSYEGAWATKADLIKAFRLPPAEAKVTRELQDFQVHESGDTAVATYLVIEKVELNNQQSSAAFLYTDTFVKRENRWRLLASHATRLASQPKVAHVNPSVYDAYIGQYAMSPTLIFTVKREGNKLIGQAPDGSTVELLPENENTFFIRGRSMRTVFVKDEKGRVTEMIFRGEGDDRRLKRIN